ncbi:MAG: DUF4160 domain-containing protein [Rhodocyclaceae bacterium]|nr:DUF4160 domain-containing protein [Rhodocyclaceae bacterium]
MRGLVRLKLAPCQPSAKLREFRFFFSGAEEESTTPHIHIEHGDKAAKYWLSPVELAESEGFRSHELTRVRTLVIEHRALFLERWHEHFGNPT